ncbi:MAG: sodium/proton-translocating pyrophosphatase, partial [Candidatus Omnitrophica bacterium]|nr:sodium/proton-translocating pyrophosphatase [Candidatus Omnitrophota bacterium]
MGNFDLLLLAPVGSIAALSFAFYLAMYILRQDPGNDKMREIAAAVKVGAKAYLKRQYLGVSLFFIVIFILLLFMAL